MRNKTEVYSDVARWSRGKESIVSFKKLLIKLEKQVKTQGAKKIYVDFEIDDEIVFCVYGTK